MTDLTPDHPVPLGGYGARKGKPMAGVHDPVRAKALWLESGDDKICLVATDLIGSLDSLRKDVLNKIPESLGLERRLILAASHTHSGPGGLVRDNPLARIAMGPYDERLYESCVDRIAQAVLRAADSRRPACLGIATGTEPSLSRNRRSEHYATPADAPIDPEILVLEVRDLEGRPFALLAHFTAHPTVLGSGNMLVSADWPGALQRRLEERLPGTIALFANGAEGDIAPRAPPAEDDFLRCEAMGSALAERVMEIRNAVANPSPRVRIRYEERAVDLPKTSAKFVPRRSVLGLLEVDGSAFLCVPGEMGVEIGLRLKEEFRRRFGFRTATILGLANDHLGYFLTREQYRKGGYERQVSFYGAGMADFLTDRFLELGKELSARR